MWLPSGPVLFGALALLLLAHVAVTYCASERLNVFTALLMLSLLPALALGFWPASSRRSWRMIARPR